MPLDQTVTLADLTTAKVGGTGVFDTLMTAMVAHLDVEYSGQRLKGQDYASVYLGSLTAVLNSSVAFLLSRDEAGSKTALIQAQIDKIVQETANLVLEGENLKAQNCLLKAQFDLTMLQKLQTTAQTSLIQQKIATEKAQTIETGVDDNSVIGKQKLLYKAQTDGFARDSEQKLLKILVDTWNVRRTTDDGTIADGINQLQDATIGRVVNKSLTGVGA